MYSNFINLLIVFSYFPGEGGAAAPQNPPVFFLLSKSPDHICHSRSAQLNKSFGFINFWGSFWLPTRGFIIIGRWNRCTGQLTMEETLTSWKRQLHDSVFLHSFAGQLLKIQALLKVHFLRKYQMLLRIGYISRRNPTGLIAFFFSTVAIFPWRWSDLPKSKVC